MSINENEKVWVASHSNEAFGPLTATEIKQALNEKKLHNEDFVWKKGWSQWKTVKDIPLFNYEAKTSIGATIADFNLPVPEVANFESITTPLLSGADLNSFNDWNAKRLTIVGASYFFAGPLGAVVAGVLTHTGETTRNKIEKNDNSYVQEKNK